MKNYQKVLTWLLTFLFIGLCILAGNWQLDKGLKLNQKNKDISARATLKPIIDPTNIDPKKDQWRLFQMDGTFTPHIRLVKNQYQDGQFGFHILQEFNSKTLGAISIDRGWVKAGKNAQTPPHIPAILQTNDRLVLRLRSEFLNIHLTGTLFAIPSKHETKREIYFDLISAQVNQPITILELPNLSTGPHFAYAFQWYLFALLAVVGRIMIGKRVKR